MMWSRSICSSNVRTILFRYIVVHINALHCTGIKWLKPLNSFLPKRKRPHLWTTTLHLCTYHTLRTPLVIESRHQLVWKENKEDTVDCTQSSKKERYYVVYRKNHSFISMCRIHEKIFLAFTTVLPLLRKPSTPIIKQKKLSGIRLNDKNMRSSFCSTLDDLLKSGHLESWPLNPTWGVVQIEHVH